MRPVAYGRKIKKPDSTKNTATPASITSAGVATNPARGPASDAT